MGTCRLNGTRGSRVKKSVTLCQSRRCRVTHHCSGLGEKQAQAQEGDRASISQLCSPNHVAEGVFRRSEVAGKDLNNTGDKSAERRWGAVPTPLFYFRRTGSSKRPAQHCHGHLCPCTGLVTDCCIRGLAELNHHGSSIRYRSQVML